jgi:hypothetical protein
MDAVVEQVMQEARQELSRGKKTNAARLLTDAVYRTRDPETINEIKRLAEEGKSQSGMFGKGRWNEILRVADTRTNGATGTANGAAG